MKTGGVKTLLDPLRQLRTERASDGSGLTVDAPLTVGGRELVPDQSRGYVVMEICHAFPSVTHYGTALHPRTIARHYPTMRDQVFNLGHRMKSYLSAQQMALLPSSEKRDVMLGTIVAVEFPPEPTGGWRLSLATPAPCIRAAAAFAKQSEAAAVVLRQQDRWSVSQEINFTLADSGWLVLEPAKAPDCRATTPDEVSALGLGYVPCVEAPQALMDCYDDAQARVTKRWGDSPVVLLKGGLGDGVVHWMGVGYVETPAEKEARVLTVLAGREATAEAAALADFAAALKESNKKCLTAMAEAVGSPAL